MEKIEINDEDNIENGENQKNHSVFIYLLIALTIGFGISYFFNYRGNRSGSNLREMVLLTNKNCYHVHHFMFIGVMIISILFGKYLKNDAIIFSTIGLLIGVSMEDLLYKDWYVIKNNCHKSKLIKFMKNTKDVNKKYN